MSSDPEAKQRWRHEQRCRTSRDVVNYLIDKQGMRASNIATICGVNRSHISRVRTGERELATVKLSALAEHIGMSFGAMLSAIHPPKVDHPDPRVRDLQRKCVEALQAFDRLAALLKERREQEKTSAA